MPVAKTNTVDESAASINLRRLVLLRNILLLAQAAAIALAVYTLRIPLPTKPLLIVLAIYALFNAYTYWRLAQQRPVPASSFFLQVCADVIALYVLLYLSGGAANPFVSLLLLPLIIVATTMSRNYVWLMTAITVLAYSSLLWWQEELPHMHASEGAADFNQHVLGMWLGFMVGAGLIVTFVASMAENLRERDRKLAAIRERMIQDESLVALASQAAGAAHELATPLATMAVIIREMEQHGDQVPEILQQTRILRQQVDRCKTTLNRMTADAGQQRAEEGGVQRLDDFLRQTIMQWQSMRPKARIQQQANGSLPSPQIIADTTLMQAIINILNNAADAGGDDADVNFEARWDTGQLVIQVCDQGPGLPSGGTPGQAFFTTKADGRGLGLFLARSVLERVGGKLSLSNRQTGGVCARIELPLAPILAREHGA